MGLEVMSASTTGQVHLNVGLDEFVKNMSAGIKYNPNFLDTPGFAFETVPDSTVVLASTPSAAQSASTDQGFFKS